MRSGVPKTSSGGSGLPSRTGPSPSTAFSPVPSSATHSSTSSAAAKSIETTRRPGASGRRSGSAEPPTYATTKT